MASRLHEISAGGHPRAHENYVAPVLVGVGGGGFGVEDDLHVLLFREHGLQALSRSQGSMRRAEWTRGR